MLKPRYPIFIPSKGRSDVCLTPKLFLRWHVPFTFVVEPQEHDIYAQRFPSVPILVLPRNNGGLIFARNWIWDYSVEQGDERHWQIDDNIRQYYRRYKATRLYCDPNLAIAICEDFTDRYENVALSGLNYRGFVPDKIHRPPFVHNCHVYSNTLIKNDIPFRYRPPANEDTDLCLQVLAGGLCTIQLNAFVAGKATTMAIKGGQTDAAYQGDGRLKMSRSLERVWPGVVSTYRRFQRPQHMIKDHWKRFDTPLKFKAGVRLEDFKKPNEYGMSLKQVKPTIKSEKVRTIMDEYNNKHKGDS